MESSSRRERLLLIVGALSVSLRDVASVESIPTYYAAHPGMRYDNVTSTSVESSFRACTAKCSRTTSSTSSTCFAFNYRESDGSCQLVFNGRSGLAEANGYGSYVQNLCLRDTPKIPNSNSSFSAWNGEHPAPPGATVTFRCERPKKFSDGSTLHTARCSVASPDSWCSSFLEDRVRCEEQHTRYPECRLTEKGREYVGKANETESGKECLRWDTQPYGTPPDFSNATDYDGHFPNLDSWSQHNYCRNPSGRARPWCFVSSPQVQWEYCDIPLCPDTDPPECKVTQQGGEYIGKKRMTLSGLPCQPWRSREPHANAVTMIEKDILGFPDADEVDERHDFCRNPNGGAAPWCWNGGGDTPLWEFCDISFCDLGEVRKGAEGNVYPECRLTEKGKEYVGTMNVTERGMPCLDWASNPYGTPWDFYLPDYTYARHFLNWDPLSHKNHCRNPSLYRERPWCFVSDDDILWDYCDIPFCHDLKPPECKLTEEGGEYTGRKNVSISGFPCQHWMASVPYFPETVQTYLSSLPEEVDGRNNFCRNSEGSSHGPWCYTITETGSTWEYCDVPFCPAEGGERCKIRKSGKCVSWEECRRTMKGLEYMGTKNVTRSGYPCQPWLRNSPNLIENDAYYFRAGFPDDLHPSHNFCRNPSAVPDGLWCWNGAGTSPKWERCDVPFCQGVTNPP